MINKDKKTKKENTQSFSTWTEGLDIKNFIQDIGLVGIAEILVSLGGLILIPLITKTLGEAGYGLWRQMLVTIGILSPIASLGLNNALVRFLPAKKQIKDKQNIFFSIIIFKFLISGLVLAVLYFFSEEIAYYFFDNATYIVVLTGLIFLVGGINILCQFYFRALRKIKLYSLFRVMDSFAKIAAIYYMIYNGKGIQGAIFAYLCVELFFTIIYLLVITKNLGFSLPRFKGMRKWLKYGIPLIPTGISLWVIMFSDRYLIAYLLNIKYLGIYSAAYDIGFAFFMVIELIDFVLVPTISKHYDNGEVVEVKKYLRYVFNLFLLFAIPAVAALAVLSEPILRLFTTPTIAKEAWMITPLIAFCALLFAIYVVYDKTLRMTQKTLRIGAVVSISAVINIILNLYLIPRYGIFGAAIATLIAYGFSTLVIILLSIREFRFGFDKVVILKFISASILMASLAYFWQPVYALSLILCIFSCIIFYFLLLFLFGIFTKKDISFLLSLIKTKK